ncbi:hypothetical protein BDQ17DRAFT_1323087 [Cyathus striatus]|nr:hypothetical protein BDQ17DRAFT_1323087 [Cyathus striatus]
MEVDGAPPSSRRRSRSPPAKVDLPRVMDADPVRKAERERQLAARVAAMELEKSEKPKIRRRLHPPARLRAMQAAASSDKNSPEYQRMTWDALRKSITGIVNRVNIANIKQVVPELFQENLIRGRGLFSRSVMKAQSSSLPFTPVFAALVAIINTKLPQVGELLLTRLISQFRRAFKRNDKIVCHSTTTFIAHLVNQTVAHEIIALQILVLLLERPTDDSIEIAVGFMREVGAFLTENSPKATATVFERFRAVLNEGNISHRVQYMIEVLMQVRKDKFKDNPILPEGLDLVEEDEQITHQIQLEEELQVQDGLNIFKFDPKYMENEEKYKSIRAEILGEDSDEETDSSEDESSEDENEVVEDKPGIEDRTETNLVNLRRIIYLTIMNALNYEEAVHKLLKVQLQEGEEIEMVNMVIECCSQERSYSTFYGLIGERFSKLNRVWTDAFEEAFTNYYTTIHRYETNRLRNIARFFGHLLATDAISWVVFECVKVNEDDTTSSSRIFIKILMQEMMENMGLKTLAERFKDPEVKRACEGMFPTDVPKNTRFAINYFTSIGLGLVTEDMREYLKNAPRLIMEQRRAMLEAESSSSDSDESDTTSSSDSSSDSDSESDSASSIVRHRRRRSSTPPRRRGRDDSRTPSRSPPRRRGKDDSESPPPRRRVVSRSPSPPPRRRADSRSPPPPPRRRADSPPPRRRDDSLPPVRRRIDSPPPRRRVDSPPLRRRGDSPRRPADSPPSRRRHDSKSPPLRKRDISPPPRKRDISPPPRKRDISPPPIKKEDKDVDMDAPPRRRDSPPPRSGGGRPRSPSPRARYGGGRGNVRSRSPPPHMVRNGRRSPPPHMRRRDDSRERGGSYRDRERDRGYERRR